MLRSLLKIILFVVGLAVAFLGGLILYGTITDYKPEPGSSIELPVNAGGKPSSDIDSTINLMSWNVGYGGLGKEMDFFYDGGKAVRAPREIWNKDLAGQIDILTKNDSIDFYLIQEIDQLSKRSYEVNQYDSVYHSLPDYASAFGLNYNVKYVPLPFTNGLGKVYSGIATFSRYTPASAQRYQYPGHFAWPTRIFFLDRCFMPEYFPLSNGKQLVVINTHNSAYDESGEIKKGEMEFLKQYMLEAYKGGNYVIIGGDFNQCPPGFDTKKFLKEEKAHNFIPPAFDDTWLPEGWQFCYDDSQPTNRDLDKPLHDKTFKTIIDYFLISPNVELKSVKTIDAGFDFSDHQPVVMKVKLN